jgi:hypothetical protein
MGRLSSGLAELAYEKNPPTARCLIHNAHLGKIIDFCKILDLKITYLKKKFDQYICLISAVIIKA